MTLPKHMKAMHNPFKNTLVALAVWLVCLLLSLQGCHSLRSDATTTKKNNDLVSTLPDNDVYSGQLNDGQPEGIGSMSYAAGQRYSGIWHAGQKHGEGILTLPATNSLYVGQFFDDSRTGFGRLISQQFEYSGQWHQNMPHGYGVFRLDWGGKKGQFYAGYWHQGVRWGTGFSVLSKGIHYVGDWQQDVPNGFGESTSSGGVWFEGAWEQGHKHGYGRSLEQAGNSYEGSWLEDKKHGYGIETYIDGFRYAGQWQAGLRSGQGLAQFNSGVEHDGQWHDNKPQGMGTRTFPEGHSITGVWQNNSIAVGHIRLNDKTDKAYLGELNLNTKNIKEQPLSQKLINWLEKAAEAEKAAEEGAVTAQSLLIRALSWNKTTATFYWQRITYWLEQIVDNSPSAAFRLAELYLNDANSTETLYKKAVELLNKAADQANPHALLTLGNLYYNGEHVIKNDQLASKYFDSAFKKGSITARNNLAWLLATSADTTIRNGQRALILIHPVVRGSPSFQHLDTLAAVYAELGHFKSAQTAQTRALQLTEDQAMLAAMQQRLTYYKNNQPWYE